MFYNHINCATKFEYLLDLFVRNELNIFNATVILFFFGSLSREMCTNPQIVIIITFLLSNNHYLEIKIKILTKLTIYTENVQLYDSQFVKFCKNGRIFKQMY